MLNYKPPLFSCLENNYHVPLTKTAKKRGCPIFLGQPLYASQKLISIYTALRAVLIIEMIYVVAFATCESAKYLIVRTICDV